MDAKAGKPKKPQTQIVAFALTPDDVAMLARFAKDATQRCGRSIGRSAVVRALLGHVAAQPRDFAEQYLLPRVRDGLAARPWGGSLPFSRKKRARVKQ